MVKVWDVKTGELKSTFTVTGNATYTVRMTPKYVVTSSADGSLRAWDWKAGKEVFELDVTLGYIRDLSFSQTGRRMAGVAQGKLVIWDLGTGKESHRLGSEEHRLVNCAVHPQGRFIATSGSDGRVRIWDLNTSKQVIDFEAGRVANTRIGWTRDGQAVVSLGSDGVLRVFGRK